MTPMRRRLPRLAGERPGDITLFSMLPSAPVLERELFSIRRSTTVGQARPPKADMSASTIVGRFADAASPAALKSLLPEPPLPAARGKGSLEGVILRCWHSPGEFRRP